MPWIYRDDGAEDRAGELIDALDQLAGDAHSVFGGRGPTFDAITKAYAEAVKERAANDCALQGV